MTNIKGLKKAVGDYQRANAGGQYSPEYGELMYDKATGELWTDTFYSIGHNCWRNYQTETVVNLGRMMHEQWPDIAVTMTTVKDFIKSKF